ncbi:protein of unknown function DUF3310 [Vibrio phage 1.063.O._10N.261.45.C7]|nr:protein of unknown function DUF3310 [Vibrio phage 1.063.O._10N.261.45.C7]
MSALNKQIGGQHYKKGKIQPIELAYMLGQTPAFCKVAKYATRIKDAPVQQLKKAMHCIELDEELKDYAHLYCKVDNDFAWDMIAEFTENPDLRRVLYNMHCGYYTSALFFMEDMIEEEEKRKDE